jgi:Zn-dependent oligopeptidase
MQCQKKSTYRGFTPAQAEANRRYMQNFVEVKVRMSPEKRTAVKDHAAMVGESSTAFINRAIDETMKNDHEE